MSEELLSVLAASAGALVPQYEAEIVLGGGPLLRELRFRTDRQGGTIGGDGLGEQLGAGLAAGAGALVAEHIAEILLGHGPVLRELLFRIDHQGGLIGGHCVSEVVVNPISLCPNTDIVFRIPNQQGKVCPQTRVVALRRELSGLLIRKKGEVEAIVIGMGVTCQPKIADGLFRELLGCGRSLTSLAYLSCC